MYTDVLPLAVHAIAGAAAAAIVAMSARALGALTQSGAVAAIAVGTCAALAGWAWAGLLVFFFVTSSALSRVGTATKARRTAGLIAKSGGRDAAQVIANGGVFAAGALLTSFAPSAVVAAASLGALAAAAGDTWATEIGTLSSATPRSILTMQPVEPGTSGGITIIGTLAGFAGAGAIATGSGLIRADSAFVSSVALGGAAGMLADSVLGASAQARLWCDQCQCATEQRIHACRATTRHVGGLRWLNNDGVNVLATLIGAGVATSLAAWFWSAS